MTDTLAKLSPWAVSLGVNPATLLGLICIGVFALICVGLKITK